MAMTSTKYSQIRDSFATGDVVTFSGTSQLDYAIQMAEGKPYNHVGIVIRIGNNLFLWDAPGGGAQFPDPYKNNRPHGGCRVAPLDLLLADYMKTEAGMYYRKLQPALTEHEIAAMNIFINMVDGMPFPAQALQMPDQLNLGTGLALSYFLGKQLKATIAGSYFCAHLIADTYMHMGLLPKAPIPANGYTPADFDGNQNELPLIGHALSNVVQVIYDIGTLAAPATTSA